ncbi:hypothetical protein COA17_18675 [Sphingomonas ginsenosidimutans]|uniref:Uncharacterized protein n=1 Tax=Sphingomonas ginsenosidimutans TaxID=862134 RepID=A0A2A4HUN6_9SPHN|nr:hypothetical protein COA17_18675 [Sphingomonas ginsenosidimutans]
MTGRSRSPSKSASSDLLSPCVRTLPVDEEFFICSHWPMPRISDDLLLTHLEVALVDRRGKRTPVAG